jgi:hypothetical protein
MKALGTC